MEILKQNLQTEIGLKSVMAHHIINKVPLMELSLNIPNRSQTCCIINVTNIDTNFCFPN